MMPPVISRRPSVSFSRPKHPRAGLDKSNSPLPLPHAAHPASIGKKQANSNLSCTSTDIMQSLATDPGVPQVYVTHMLRQAASNTSWNALPHVLTLSSEAIQQGGYWLPCKIRLGDTIRYRLILCIPSQHRGHRGTLHLYPKEVTESYYRNFVGVRWKNEHAAAKAVREAIETNCKTVMAGKAKDDKVRCSHWPCTGLISRNCVYRDFAAYCMKCGRMTGLMDVTEENELILNLIYCNLLPREGNGE